MGSIFSKNVEKLINPISVGSLHFIQSFNQYIPKSIQKILVKSSAKKIPFMGFVVEPYATFLCYEIINIETVKKLIPKGFSLIKTSIFDDDIPKYYCLFGCFRSHTSAFWGTRAECYIIAQNDATGLLSWLIIDYDTDTISYDQAHGLRSPNCKTAIFEIDHNADIYSEIVNNSNRKLIFNINIKNAQFKKLNQRLWLEGNLSIGYGTNLSKTPDIFSLKFEPHEVAEAYTIPVKSANISCNNWFSGLFANSPSQIVCFPYAQHFVSDSPGYSSNIKNKAELVDSINKIDFQKIKVFSSDSFKKSMLFSSAASLLIILVLIVLLIIK
jgi:hypothetical protein